MRKSSTFISYLPKLIIKMLSILTISEFIATIPSKQVEGHITQTVLKINFEKYVYVVNLKVKL